MSQVVAVKRKTGDEEDEGEDYLLTGANTACIHLVSEFIRSMYYLSGSPSRMVRLLNSSWHMPLMQCANRQVQIIKINNQRMEGINPHMTLEVRRTEKILNVAHSTLLTWLSQKKKEKRSTPSTVRKEKSGSAPLFIYSRCSPSGIPPVLLRRPRNKRTGRGGGSPGTRPCKETKVAKRNHFTAEQQLLADCVFWRGFKVKKVNSQHASVGLGAKKRSQWSK